MRKEEIIRKRGYFIIGAVCALLLIAWIIAGAEEPAFGSGLAFRGTPIVIAIPRGHPDFTVFGVASQTEITKEITLLGIKRVDMSGYYELLVCENEPRVLALHHSGRDGDSYWLYPNNMMVIEASEEEFEGMKVEAQYMCREEKSEEV